MVGLNKTALIVAAHPDDEVLGCGGTIAQLVKQNWLVHVVFLADGESSRSGINQTLVKEFIATRRLQAKRALGLLGCASWRFGDFADNMLDTVPLLELVKFLEQIIDELSPSRVYTHFPGDLNIDHQRVSRAVLTACRPVAGHPVEELFYFEVPSSTEWNCETAFRPNCFVDVTNELDLKIQAMSIYERELQDFPHPRSEVSLRAISAFRGASSGLKAAEAFIIARKIIRNRGV